MARGPRVETYMTPDDFAALGERAFGKGWQARFAEFIGYDRVSISEYAQGTRPVPILVTLALQGVVAKLDNGEAVQLLQPVGTVIDGCFAKARKAR